MVLSGPGRAWDLWPAQAAGIALATSWQQGPHREEDWPEEEGVVSNSDPGLEDHWGSSLILKAHSKFLGEVHS